MTHEEKLQEAKRLYKTANSDQRYVLESLFPELKESEDERIRGAIIHFISHTPTVPKGIIGKETMISWLEKQGADKPYYTDLLGYFEIGKRLNHSVEEIRNWLKSKI